MTCVESQSLMSRVYDRKENGCVLEGMLWQRSEALNMPLHPEIIEISDDTDGGALTQATSERLPRHDLSRLQQPMASAFTFGCRVLRVLVAGKSQVVDDHTREVVSFRVFEGSFGAEFSGRVSDQDMVSFGLTPWSASGPNFKNRTAPLAPPPPPPTDRRASRNSAETGCRNSLPLIRNPPGSRSETMGTHVSQRGPEVELPMHGETQMHDTFSIRFFG